MERPQKLIYKKTKSIVSSERHYGKCQIMILPNGTPVISIPLAATSVQIRNLTSPSWWTKKNENTIGLEIVISPVKNQEVKGIL